VSLRDTAVSPPGGDGGPGLLSLLGGLGSAGEAFRRWGESAAARRERAPSGS
jgi:hypothetical protein